jgi:hypothetical protein
MSHTSIFILNRTRPGFYKNKLGFEVRTDASDGFRWLTVGPKPA